MQYFCNVRLANLKNLESLVGKNLTFGGIVTNVQFRTGKNGKDWAMFTLEGYDESHDFRIFDEEYLKFRHFLVNNQFVYFRVNIKDGWVNRETGKKSEPRITFIDAKLLADVLPTFAKKLSIQLNIIDLQQNLIQHLRSIFQANQGDKIVHFEVIETEIIKKKIEEDVINIPAAIERNDADDYDIDTINENEVIEEIAPLEVDQIRKVTTLGMTSRKIKVAISKDLLQELERMQVKFSLN
jgi:DNA polymerase-3 subunit alpha